MVVGGIVVRTTTKTPTLLGNGDLRRCCRLGPPPAGGRCPRGAAARGGVLTDGSRGPAPSTPKRASDKRGGARRGRSEERNIF